MNPLIGDYKNRMCLKMLYMTNKAKSSILFLLFVLIIQAANGQDRSNMTDYLRQRFVNYCKSVPREEIYVHNDRDGYIAGEEMWFSVYLFDRQSGQLSSSGSIAYFELINSDNRPVVQKRISLTNGFGKGQADLPDSLSSGTYTIRTYTNYMKNFLPENCFTREIKIYNAFSSKASYSGSGKIEKPAGLERRGLNKSGLSIAANNLNPINLELTISADDRYRSENRNMCYLFLQTHGLVNRVSQEILSGENTKILIPKSQLTEGIGQITLFNQNGEPLCEKYIYTPSAESSSWTVKTVDSVAVRSRVAFEVDLGKIENLSDLSGFSVSVAPVSRIKDENNISDYLIFGSEYGLMPYKLSAGKKPVNIPEDVMEDILMNLKSNWINWNEIITGKLPEINYPHEKDSHYLTGKLLTRNSQLPDTGKYVFLSTPGKDAVFQYAMTDKNGRFRFSIKADENVNDLVIQPADGNKNNTVKIESPFFESYGTRLNSGKAVPDDSLMTYFSKLSANYQINRIYGILNLGEKNIATKSSFKRIRFYGKPDVGLVMADYIKLPVMQEVFFELLPGVFLKSKKTGYEITMADPLTNRINELPPVLLIDGVIINDASLIGNLDPEIVERIDVVKDKYYVGNYMFWGVVNVITHSADFSSVQLPPYAVRMTFTSADGSWNFSAPQYSSEEFRSSRIPDFRNTIYWNPYVKPGKDGKVMVDFWSADQKSDYEIKIEGVADGGKKVSVSKIIKVR